ncbi:MAG: hypothetical protein WC248_04535 [Candidatus Methanomethylophilaceae archaeon]|jgi:hypothetical protein
MKGRPIIMSGGEVRAILEGRKSQMRRPIKPQPGVDKDFFGWRKDFACFGVSPMTTLDVRSTYIPGDHLWVKETFVGCPDGISFLYKADPMFAGCNKGDFTWNWKSPMYMPRRASRILLKITNIRVERLQDITEKDAKAEGIGLKDTINVTATNPPMPFKHAYAMYWDNKHYAKGWNYKIHTKGNRWDDNPWVFVIEFKVVNK